jgi:hypothetical protein
MFDFFRKKTQLETLIKNEGLEKVVDFSAHSLIKGLKEIETIYQFILEELDGASVGNKASKDFANSIKIPREKYYGTLNRSIPQVEELQQKMMVWCMDLRHDQELMAKFRCEVNRKLIRLFNIEAYHLDPVDTIKNLNTLDAQMLRKDGDNYLVQGHTLYIVDFQTKDKLVISFKDGKYGGILNIRNGPSLGLAQWHIGENPFQDQHCYEGVFQGKEFCVRTDNSFEFLLGKIK